jgi:hypothetical protein
MVAGSSVIFGAYIVYALATITVLRWRPSPEIALASMFFGWLFLPVEVYPATAITPANFTVDVIGTILPGEVLVTKALIVPLAVLFGLVVAMPQSLLRFRPGAVDVAMGLFCLSPALPWAAGKVTAASAIAQIGYLAGTWGGTWIIGRALLGGRHGRRALIDTMIVSGIALLPIALLEGVHRPWLYGAVFGPHPFQLEGAARYFGFRPLGFFEHGTQYGIWIAVAALAAIFRWLTRAPRSAADLAVAAVLALAAIASQSFGAVILLCLGCVWLAMPSGARRFAVIAAGLLLAIGGIVYLSGRLPLEDWAFHTAIGRKTWQALRFIDRASFVYRVHHDQMALPLIFHEPLTGYGVWDWWRPLKSHPWGLPLLIAGQYGVPAAILLAAVLLGGAVRRLYRGRSGIVSLIVVIAAIDAWLNSYIYFPAILACAAVAVPLRGPERDARRQGNGEEQKEQEEEGAGRAQALSPVMGAACAV